MNTWGEDAPTLDDISEFGLLYACQRTIGNFSLYQDGQFAARGRSGTSPLFWNRNALAFSFTPKLGFTEFPMGCLYNGEQDRLVCWDPMYYDKPMETGKNALEMLDMLLRRAVNRFPYNYFIKQGTVGSKIIQKYLDNPPSSSDEDQKYTIVMCDVGCDDLFKESLDYDPRGITGYVNEFARVNIRIWSPFFDKELVDFVLDATSPSDRPILLREILLDEY